MLTIGLLGGTMIASARAQGREHARRGPRRADPGEAHAADAAARRAA